MNDAKRFRARADRCLQMARLMSDPTLAEKFNADAVDFAERALEIETEIEHRELESWRLNC
jgi:hypothetical protein